MAWSASTGLLFRGGFDDVGVISVLGSPVNGMVDSTVVGVAQSPPVQIQNPCSSVVLVEIVVVLDSPIPGVLGYSAEVVESPAGGAISSGRPGVENGTTTLVLGLVSRAWVLGVVTLDTSAVGVDSVTR